MYEYWDPASFHKPETELIEGIFEQEDCLNCHEDVTPGIVNDWKTSTHASPVGKEPVGCGKCHGSDHQKLAFPTPETCKECHERQYSQFMADKRYGYPSHALAMERAVDAKHFADKPKAETASCVQCHSVATKCDSCHTRHKFSAAEARRPEACITCHSGPPHPDDEAYLTSPHGKQYLENRDKQDWEKTLNKDNYKFPTCAYCHMKDSHQVAEKAVWKFGIKEVNPHTSQNKVKREKWIRLCSDCHERKVAEEFFSNLNKERREKWLKLYEMEDLLKELRSEGFINPSAGKRPLYPMDFLDSIYPFARIGFYEGQASAFYNVSYIERLYFEMWYFDNLAGYKGSAHGSNKITEKGKAGMVEREKMIIKEARELREIGMREKNAATAYDPGPLWQNGDYTTLNKDHN